MKSHCDQIAISWHEARNRSTCTALLLHWSATREQQESSQQQDQRETISSTVLCMLVSDRLHVQNKSSETYHTTPGQLLILLVHHTHGFELVGSCGVLSPKRGQQLHEALEFLSASRWRNMVSGVASGRQSGARQPNVSLWR